MNDRYKKTTILMIVIALLACSAKAAEREFRALSTSNGLSDLVVNRIFKDSTGYIWFGTGTALDRFDGTRLYNYWIPGDNSMLKRVNAIAEMSDGTIVIGNGNGLYAIDSSTESLVPFLQDKINFSVNALIQKDGILYAGTRRGLFIIDDKGQHIEHVMPHSDIMSDNNAIYDIAADSTGAVWMSAADGLLYYKNRTLKHYPTNLPGMVISKVLPLGDKIYTATKEHGIQALDPATGQFSGILDLDNMPVSALSSDGNDILYIGTDGSGVYAYSTSSNKTVEHLTHDSRLLQTGALRSNSVYSILVDDEGLIWVGYYQAGVDYTPMRRDIFDVYGYGSFDSEEKTIRAIAINGSEKLIGTREGLYYINESTRQAAYFCVPRIRANMVFAITGHKGKYYIGTFNGGMYVFDPASMILKDFDPDNEALTNGSVFSIVIDDTDNIWIGTSNGLFRYADGLQKAHYTYGNSRLPQGNVYEIYFDSSGRGWICTDNGLCIWDGTSLRDNGFPKGFPNKEKIRDIYETSDHYLYFVPDKGRIFRSNLHLTEFGYPDIFGQGDNPTASFIIEDRHGKLWIGLNSGLVCIDHEGTSHIFSDVDGLPGTIFTLCPPVIDDNDDIWFGNSRGLVHLDYDRLASGKYESGKTIVSDISINGKRTPIDNHRLLTSDEIHIDIHTGEMPITFRFADLSYVEPEHQLYEYMMEGIDRKWNLMTGNAEVTYYDLPPGRHRLLLRYAGDKNSERTLDLTVRKRINWMEILLATLLVIAVGTALYFYIQHKRHGSGAKTPNLSPAGESPEKTRSGQDKYRTSRLSDKECRALNRSLEELMETKKPYINPDLKIADIAAELSTSSHAMSFLFNQYLKKNYYDYINEYRVEEFKRMVKAGDTSRFTLTAMSERCGFSSRASFFRHFKKFCGITPSEYIKHAQK